MTNKHIFDLGKWEPKLISVFPERVYSGEFVEAWEKFLGQKVNNSLMQPEVRGPLYHRQTYYTVSKWHQDDNGALNWLLIWSNIFPTDIRPKRLLHPFHVYAIRNSFFFHKTPQKAKNAKRWFARAYVTDEILELKK